MCLVKTEWGRERGSPTAMNHVRVIPEQEQWMKKCSLLWLYLHCSLRGSREGLEHHICPQVPQSIAYGISPTTPYSISCKLPLIHILSPNISAWRTHFWAGHAWVQGRTSWSPEVTFRLNYPMIPWPYCRPGLLPVFAMDLGKENNAATFVCHSRSLQCG